jgi:hypothetical protein
LPTAVASERHRTNDKGLQSYEIHRGYSISDFLRKREAGPSGVYFDFYFYFDFYDDCDCDRRFRRDAHFQGRHIVTHAILLSASTLAMLIRRRESSMAPNCLSSFSAYVAVSRWTPMRSAMS